MKKQYYVLVRVLKGDEKTETDKMELVCGTLYTVGTLRQASEDIEFVDDYMNNQIREEV